jgi:cytoskeleton protein RodZ
VAGYVRSYARYLGLNEEQTLRRFCAESGFEPQAGIAPTRVPGRAVSAAARADLDAVIAGSRLAAVSRTETFNGELGATLRGLGSLAVLMAVVGGLGYGGWTVLENIQRVDFSPLPEAPIALASAPTLEGAPQASGVPNAAGAAIDTREFVAVYAAQELMPPQIDLRDTPISTIDPRNAGIYGAARAATALRGSARASVPAPMQAPAMAEVDALAQAPVVMHGAASDEGNDPSVAQAVDPMRVALVFTGEAWVRVRDANGRTVHEALMQPGSRWAAPPAAEGLTLRAGNAGGVYVEIGTTLYGPLGGAGRVVPSLSLDPQTLRDTLDSQQPALTTSALENGALRAQ